MKIKNRIMKANILPMMMVGLLLGACSSEPVVVKKGETFTFDSQEMNIDYKASTILTNDEDKKTIIAPEGKIYVVVDITTKHDMYFTYLKDGETELKKVDYLKSKPFVRDLDLVTDPSSSDLFLLDITNQNYAVTITAGSETASLALGALTDETTIEVSDKMKDFLNEFESGSNLLDVVQKYIKDGVDVYDVVSEDGSDVPANPPTTGVEIDYIAADGTYLCSAEFGVESMEIIWDGENISKLSFK